jgi:chromosome segregation protein
VTVDGDLYGADWAEGGTGRGRSAIEIQAAVEEARDRLAAAHRSAEAETAALEGARVEHQARRAEVRVVTEERNDAKVTRARSCERLARLDQAARSAAAEVDRAATQRARAEAARDEALATLAGFERRLASVESEPLDAEPDSYIRDEIADRLAAARQDEMEGRLTLRTAEERARALAGKADGLLRAARAEREARVRAEAARAARSRGAEVARAVVRAGESTLDRMTVSLSRAVTERDEAHTRRITREQALAQVRAKLRELSTDMEKLTDAVHRDEVLRAEQRLRIEQLEQKVAEEFGIGLDDLVEEYGPHSGIPPTALELAEYEAAKERGEQVIKPAGIPFDRATQRRRAERAEKDLSLLGRVNPLALEEFAALEERYKFLSTQLEDLKATRRDLLTVVKEVDEKILEVFAAAFEDVAREFEIVFRTLFPGGEGCLTLTDPDDLLTTGVEVEARPPGKKVKRLSLLSGGEKSLCAVAMLVSIFRARPSPFYVMDEVEAALDDTNLRRLISLFEQLREKSQLLIITHQKPTMEIADALYGVSMRGDGISQVISQRLAPTTPEPESRPVRSGVPPGRGEAGSSSATVGTARTAPRGDTDSGAPSDSTRVMPG